MSTSASKSPLTPEDRAKRPRFMGRELHRLAPGSRFFEVVKRTAIGVINDGMIHAGNLAYLAIMTLFPFFITAAAVLSLFGQSRQSQVAVGTFLHTLPHDIGELLRKPIIDVLTAKTGTLLWIAGVVNLWTVSGFIETIRDIFHRAYGTKTTAPFWRSRLSSAGAILGALLLAMLSFLAQGLLVGAENLIYRLFPWAERFAGWLGISRIIPAVMMFGALYLLFLLCTPSKYRHGASLKWPGALFTTIWWVSVTSLLPWVLGLLGGYGATYGSLAGVIVMLLFFWVVGIGFVFGAHLNAALAEPARAGLQDGPAVKAADHAVAATATGTRDEGAAGATA